MFRAELQSNATKVTDDHGMMVIVDFIRARQWKENGQRSIYIFLQFLEAYAGYDQICSRMVQQKGGKPKPDKS